MCVCVYTCGAGDGVGWGYVGGGEVAGVPGLAAGEQDGAAGRGRWALGLAHAAHFWARDLPSHGGCVVVCRVVLCLVSLCACV